MAVELILPDHELRLQAEQAIRDKYDLEYEAVLQNLPINLIGLLDEQRHFEAVAGLRLAEEGFFSETYLDVSVEQQLQQVSGMAVRRDRVVEVSSLVGLSPRAALPLVYFIIRLTMNMDMQWAFFTVTEKLSHLLQRAKIPLEFLAPANPNRVKGRDAWGRYYDHKPAVYAVRRVAVEKSLRTSAVFPTKNGLIAACLNS